MASYKILFKASVRRDLEQVAQRERRRVLERIEALATDARPRGCEKPAVSELYRVRQGQYRIVYSIQDLELTVWIVRVGHRGNVYR